MKLDTTDRLRSIRDELLSIRSKDFWEITDRGTNFDYVDDERKTRLREFFDWFPELNVGGSGRAPATAAAAPGGLGPVGGS